MDIKDFGIDIDTLPKLTLDEKAGRELLRHMLSNSGFRNSVMITKLSMFIHQVNDHLNIKIADMADDDNDIPRFIKTTLKDNPNLEVVWEMVNRSVDRHIFLLTTAYASIETNLADPDDIELVGCSAYIHALTDTAFAGFEGHAITSRMAADIRYGDRSPINGMLSAVAAARVVKGTIDRVQTQLQLFIRTSNKDYGIGTRYDVKRHE